MPTVQEWAAAAAKRELDEASKAGLTPDRQRHFGVAVVLFMEAGEYDEAARLLGKGLRKTGGYGAQFVAGLRNGVLIVEGARSLRALDDAANLSAWEAGEPYPPGDRAEAAVTEEASGR